MAVDPILRITFRKRYDSFASAHTSQYVVFFERGGGYGVGTDGRSTEYIRESGSERAASWKRKCDGQHCHPDAIKVLM